MKRKLRNGISVLLAAVFVISGALVGNQLLNYQAADKSYQQALELAGSVQADPVNSPQPSVEPEPELTEAPVPLTSAPPQEEVQPEAVLTEKPEGKPTDTQVQLLLGLDLNALRQVNDRVLGWIRIPDTGVDYPLLRVKDNNEYLRRAWDGTANNAGCIFLECRNNVDFQDFNTLIYGHYMRNGGMFGALHRYQEQEYRDEHPYIYIATDRGVRRYEVFAAYEADVVSDTYRLYFEDDNRKQSVLDEYLARSVITSEVVPTVEDHILTLSTCTGSGLYDTRWVVQAVLTDVYLN